MECFRRAYPNPDEVVYISQENIGVSLRSTPATYMEVAGDIRKAFAKAHKMKEEYFTFNGKGACPVCGGKGVIVSEMAFMDAIETTCEACGGLRYAPEALRYTLKGSSVIPSPEGVKSHRSWTFPSASHRPSSREPSSNRNCGPSWTWDCSTCI